MTKLSDDPTLTTMTTPDPIRAALERLHQYAQWSWWLGSDRTFPVHDTYEIVVAARAALDAAPPDRPAVPEGREPAAVTGEPSDEELLKIYCDARRAFYVDAAEGESDQEDRKAATIAGLRAVLAAARAALAQPEPEVAGPTRDELWAMYQDAPGITDDFADQSH